MCLSWAVFFRGWFWVYSADRLQASVRAKFHIWWGSKINVHGQQPNKKSSDHSNQPLKTCITLDQIEQIKMRGGETFIPFSIHPPWIETGGFHALLNRKLPTGRHALSISHFEIERVYCEYCEGRMGLICDDWMTVRFGYSRGGFCQFDRRSL